MEIPTLLLFALKRMENIIESPSQTQLRGEVLKRFSLLTNSMIELKYYQQTRWGKVTTFLSIKARTGSLVNAPFGARQVGQTTDQLKDTGRLQLLLLCLQALRQSYQKMLHSVRLLLQCAFH